MKFLFGRERGLKTKDGDGHYLLFSRHDRRFSMAWSRERGKDFQQDANKTRQVQATIDGGMGEN